MLILLYFFTAFSVEYNFCFISSSVIPLVQIQIVQIVYYANVVCYTSEVKFSNRVS